MNQDNFNTTTNNDEVNNIYEINDNSSVNVSDNNTVNPSSVNTPDVVEEAEEKIYDLSNFSSSDEVGVSVNSIDNSVNNQIDDGFTPKLTLVIDDTNKEVGKVVDKVVEVTNTIEDYIPEATLVIDESGKSHNVVDELHLEGLDRNKAETKEEVVPENYKEDLLKVYIGNNYEKVINKTYSFNGLILSYFYLLYRKMYVIPIVLFVICTILVYITDMWFIYLLPCLLFAFLFNKLYIKKAEVYISKINIEEKKYGDIKIECKRAGGTSFIPVICGLFLFIFIIFGIAFICAKSGSKSSFINVLELIGIDPSSFVEEVKPPKPINTIYSGVFSENKEEKINNVFDITVIDSFNDSSTDYSYYYNYFSGNGDYDKCEFKLFSPVGYVDSENLASQVKDYYEGNNSSQIENITINDIHWNKLYYTSSRNVSYVYTTNVNEKVYVIEYNIYESADFNCSLYNDIILQNIKLK